MIEGVYGRTWHLEKGERLREHKESSSKIWGEDEYRSEIIKEVGYSRGKRL